MDKHILCISVPKGTTQDEINNVRNRYKDKYKVNIIVSGGNDPEDIIKNFIKARLDT